MNTINIAADATAQRIGIGNQYENEATAVVFDCSQFAEDHGAGTAQVIHRRPTESIGYVCTNVSQEGNTVTWLVTDDDTSFTGKGQVQLRWYVDEVLRESVIFPTYILPSVASSDDAPADVKSALEQLMEWVNDNTISIEDLDERIANYFDDHPLPVDDLDTELKDIRVGTDGTVYPSAGDAVRDQVGGLKEDLNTVVFDINPNENGEFVWALRFGYWTLSEETLVWNPVTNRRFLSNAYPIKVKSGDAIHIKDCINTRFFALFSADGSTWTSLSSTTNLDKIVSTDGYVMVSARNEPQSTAFTDEDVETFFERRLTIYRKVQTNKVTKQIDNINDVKGIVVNEASYKQGYVTESSSTTEGSVLIPIEFPATIGETFIIKANLSVTHPEYFSDIKLSVRERYNNTTIRDKRYADLSEPIEYTVTKASTTSIIFTAVWVKESDSSVTTSYYENFDYSICVAKKNDDLSDVMTESGDTWEV